MVLGLSTQSERHAEDAAEALAPESYAHTSSASGDRDPALVEFDNAQGYMTSNVLYHDYQLDDIEEGDEEGSSG